MLFWSPEKTRTTKNAYFDSKRLIYNILYKRLHSTPWSWVVLWVANVCLNWIGHLQLRRLKTSKWNSLLEETVGGGSWPRCPFHSYVCPEEEHSEKQATSLEECNLFGRVHLITHHNCFFFCRIFFYYDFKFRSVAFLLDFVLFPTSAPEYALLKMY